MDSSGDVVPRSIWLHEDTGHNQEAMLEGLTLFGEIRFGTPKPERLLQRMLHIATHPGDLILDSFLGLGTTAAVAHKMGRRWIGIEMGEHAATHCLPRLQQVIDGEQGGISKAVNWLQHIQKFKSVPARAARLARCAGHAGRGGGRPPRRIARPRRPAALEPGE
ncbi:DNA methyltransferase [Polaromonas sp.]|uniref:DNA methyltransferase n=1 Tax=Polaromonas sp. TaxID=1869339 RepID=UPI003BB803CA